MSPEKTETSDAPARYAGRMKGARLVTVGLAAVVLLGAANACSTAGVAVPPEADAATIDAPLPEPVDAAEAGSLCPGPTPASYPWKPPVAADPSACSEGDLAALAAAVAAKKGLTPADMASALGPTCAACAIGALDDPAWRAILPGHAGYVGNVGGCVVRLGANETCGRATDELSTCLIVGCAGCTTRKSQDVCADALTAVDGACAGYLKTMRASCPAALMSEAFTSTGTCQSFVATVRLFCGRPASDAGGD